MDWTNIINYDDFKKLMQEEYGWSSEEWFWLLDKCTFYKSEHGFGCNAADKGKSEIFYIEWFSFKKRRYLLFYVEFLCVEPAKWSEPDEDGDVELKEDAIFKFIDIGGEINE